MDVVAEQLEHRVGIGWRKPLAAGILGHLPQIDVVEVIAEDLFGASRVSLEAMQTLSRQVPVVVHGVTLGMASSESVEPQRVRKLAKVIDALAPEFWSEHLAFVRAGGVEIGHLAAPPRSNTTLEGLVRNVRRVHSATGATPVLENIATLLAPPGEMDEIQFVRAALEATGAHLLLDLHNLYVNAENFGFDAEHYIASLPADSIRAVHVAGGRRVRGADGTLRWVDDHRHAVPAAVHHLLALVARKASKPLTVILERDGDYPQFSQLLSELEQLRAVLRDNSGAALGNWPELNAAAAGRGWPSFQAVWRALRPRVWLPQNGAAAPELAGQTSSTAGQHALELFLARLLVEQPLRERFVTERSATLQHSGLSHDACVALAQIDAAELQHAALCYTNKRHGQPAVSASHARSTQH